MAKLLKIHLIQFNLHISREYRDTFTINIDRFLKFRSGSFSLDRRQFLNKYLVTVKRTVDTGWTVSVVLSVTLAITSLAERIPLRKPVTTCLHSGRERRRDNRATGNNSNPQIIVLSGLEANEKLECRERGWVEGGTSSGISESGFRKR